jgi:hypothetical protein
MLQHMFNEMQEGERRMRRIRENKMLYHHADITARCMCGVV